MSTTPLPAPLLPPAEEADAPLSAPLLVSVEEAAAQIRVSRARMFSGFVAGGHPVPPAP